MKTTNVKKFTALSIASLLGASFIFTGCANTSGLEGIIKKILPDIGLTSNYTESVYDSLGTLKIPSSEDELFNEIEGHYQDEVLYTLDDTIAFSSDGEDSKTETQAGSEAVASESNADSSYSSSDYYDTNVRTENVLESDVVKTDGNYIYSLRCDNGLLSIVDLTTFKTVYSGIIYNDENSFDGEMYVSGDKLIVICTGSDYTEKGFFETTFVSTFDLTDRSNPEKIAEYKQSGAFESARLVNNYLYVFTTYSTSSVDKDTFLPYFNGEKINVSDIYYGHYFNSVCYTCIGTIDLSSPSECKAKKAVLTGDSTLYVSDDHIFILTDDYVTTAERSGSETSIVSLEYKDGTVNGKAIGSVSGGINDSFSVDYYNNYLRLVTTLNETTYSYSDIAGKISGSYDSVNYKNGNSLYILNDNLSLVSTLDNIEENEEIQSSRFIGDTLYFVTYENTDPLFAVDLSDPKDPKMLDGIQISGFSNYLHFYGDNLLLGIGYETDSNGFSEGVKLSMFDISDPHDLKEIDREVIDDAYLVGTDYSYKSVLADPDKNLIGFSVESTSENGEDENGFITSTDGKYLVYSYDKNEGFEKLLDETVYTNKNNYYENYIDEDVDVNDLDEATEVETENASELEITDYYQLYSIKDIRGLYAGNNFYIVKPGFGISKYNLSDFKYVDGIKLTD